MDYEDCVPQARNFLALFRSKRHFWKVFHDKTRQIVKIFPLCGKYNVCNKYRENPISQTPSNKGGINLRGD